MLANTTFMRNSEGCSALSTTGVESLVLCPQCGQLCPVDFRPWHIPQATHLNTFQLSGMMINHVEGYSTCRQREKSVLLPPPLLLPGLIAGAAGAFTSTRFCCFSSGTVNPPLIGPVD